MGAGRIFTVDPQSDRVGQAAYCATTLCATAAGFSDQPGRTRVFENSLDAGWRCYGSSDKASMISWMAPFRNAASAGSSAPICLSIFAWLFWSWLRAESRSSARAAAADFNDARMGRLLRRDKVDSSTAITRGAMAASGSIT